MHRYTLPQKAYPIHKCIQMHKYIQMHKIRGYSLPEIVLIKSFNEMKHENMNDKEPSRASYLYGDDVAIETGRDNTFNDPKPITARLANVGAV